ncbi:MAG TPA: Gfo/Idh/MocA family oxidoreductase [Acidimicrobiales bacterium]|nr:Gfo/Idh/MocA family oxidoreductase [Acidimicrobiales bacterium]
MGETTGVFAGDRGASSGAATAAAGISADGTTNDIPLRAGVAGTGFIGVVHAHAARRAGARLVGVAASSAPSAREAAQALGADRGFPDAESLVTAPDLDVVHICTPNHLHAPLARAALAAGKHVICEKPLAVDAAEAADLVAAARAAGVVATVPFVYRFYPLVREARARVASGATGAVRLVHGSYLQDWLATEDDDNWRVDPEHGGPSRAFADIGSHWCDLVEFVTGDRVAAVCAEAVTAVPERVRAEGSHAFEHHAVVGQRDNRRAVTTEDVTTVLFRTRGGVAGSLVVSQVSPGRKNRLQFEIAGAEATLAFDQEQPESLWVGRRDRSEVVVRDAAHLAPEAARYAVLPPGHPQGYQDCFDAFVADTYRAIREGGVAGIDGLPTFADGARAADITGAVLRSAHHHGWEEVPS